ncbi:MAG: ATP-binding cassette domain-containing protein, partial [Rhodothermales bacterium]|nr:ATP-binding cassette domain-containing protein [Rhodothermales bacterium]
MIQTQKISVAFGGQKVLEDLTWTIKPAQRIGLIGPNGAGKSTLLKVLAGSQTVDSGTVTIGGTETVGYLPQDAQERPSDRNVVDEALTAFEEVNELLERERRLTAALEANDDHDSADYRRLLHELDRVHLELTSEESHTTRPKTEAVLMGLGFEASDLERPMGAFSGGWRMRVALAKILLREPDYLLLDEPTNHLDIVSIDWLEGYLRSYRGSVIIVSHDRYFLDR